MFEFIPAAVRQTGSVFAGLGRSALFEAGQARAVQNASDGSQYLLRRDISGNLVQICFLELETDERTELEQNTADMLQELHERGGTFLPSGFEEFAAISKLSPDSTEISQPTVIPMPRQSE